MRTARHGSDGEQDDECGKLRGDRHGAPVRSARVAKVLGVYGAARR